MTDLQQLAECLRRVTAEVADPGVSLGSGVLWPPGHVVTNAHVVRGFHAGVRLVDGRRLEGRVIARDATADLALLRVSGAGIPAATLAAAGTTRIGDLVV